MDKRMQLLATRYVQDMLFSSDEEKEIYIYSLKRLKINYKILEELKREDGTVIIRILLQTQNYKSAPLIQLYNED